MAIGVLNINKPDAHWVKIQYLHNNNIQTYACANFDLTLNLALLRKIATIPNIPTVRPARTEASSQILS